MNYTLPLDYVSNPQSCAFYEGFYSATMNMGAFLVKIGLIFVVFDVLVYLGKMVIDKYFLQKK